MGILSQIRADFAAGTSLSELGRRDYLGLKEQFAIMAETVLSPKGSVITKLTELSLDAISSELSASNSKLYPWTDHNNRQLQIAQRDLLVN